jgi:hypothetical protein
MRVLGPFFKKKHIAQPERMKEVLVQGDLRRASRKIIPRLRAELEAADLIPEAQESLGLLEEAIKTAKEPEAEQETLDEADALLLDVKSVRDRAKAVQDALAINRYRSPPDTVHEDTRKISTRYNVAKKAIERLQGKSSTPPPPPPRASKPPPEW